MMRPRWSRTTKLVVLLLLLVLAAFLLYRFSGIIAPLTLAALLAYIISPLADFLAVRLRLPRTAAVAGLYGLLLALLITGPVLLAPELVRQVVALGNEFGRFANGVRTLSQATVIIGEVQIDLGQLLDRAVAAIGGGLEAAAAPAVDLVLNAVEFVVFTIIVIVVSFYLAKDGHHLIDALDGLVPDTYREDARRLRREINLVWSAFLRGQVILALMVAGIMTAVSLALGLRFPIALGILAGLFEFLPSLGHGLWLVVAVAVALVEGSSWLPLAHWLFALVVVGVHMVFQQFDLNYLIPRIIGGQMRLPPLVVILGIVIGATLAGVLGVALAAPVIASARILARYIYAGLFDLDPFEPRPALPTPKPLTTVPSHD